MDLLVQKGRLCGYRSLGLHLLTELLGRKSAECPARDFFLPRTSRAGLPTCGSFLSLMEVCTSQFLSWSSAVGRIMVHILLDSVG